MKQLFVLIIFFLLPGAWKATAQETTISQLYEGSIDGKLSVTMYLVAKPNPCDGELNYQGIYRYNKGSYNDWLLLDIDHNAAEQFVMVETGLSGVMLLQKNADGFSGTWIHPNGVTRKKVILKKKKASDEELKRHEQFLEDTHYRYYDC